MKALKNEKEMVRKAIAEGMKYGEARGVVEFEPTDSQTEKIEYIYKLLVQDKVIQPLARGQADHVFVAVARQDVGDMREVEVAVVALDREVDQRVVGAAVGYNLGL